MSHEDTNIATEEVEPIIEDTNPEVEEIQNDEIDLDLDLESILDSSEEEVEEEVEPTPTKPTFFPNNDSEEEIDDNILEELDESFWELETEVDSLKEQIITIEEERDNAKEEALAFWNWLDIISQHPVLWPLSDKLLKGEELNIPELLTKSLEEDLDELPNMEHIANELTEVNTPPSLQDKLSKRASQMY